MSQRIVASVLSGAALQESVLSRYRLPAPLSCRYLTGGLNDTYRVTAGADTYYLRLYRCRWRRKQDIEAEVDMLAYLARHKQPVSRAVPRKDSRYLTRVAAPEGTRWAVLFTEAPGKPPRPDPGTCRAYGVIIGDMHVCLDRRAVDKRRFHLDLEHLLDEPLRNIEPFLRERPEDFAYLTSVAAQLRAAIEDLLPRTAPEYGCCHGDHHGGNVHRDGRGPLVVFDFDCYGYGWRAYDLGVFLWEKTHGFGGDRKGRAKLARRWDALLEGYGRARTLSAAEIEATRVFVPIRQIWWMGLHMYMKGREAWGGFVNDGFFDHHVQFVRECMRYFRI